MFPTDSLRWEVFLNHAKRVCFALLRLKHFLCLFFFFHFLTLILVFWSHRLQEPFLWIQASVERIFIYLFICCCFLWWDAVCAAGPRRPMVSLLQVFHVQVSWTHVFLPLLSSVWTREHVQVHLCGAEAMQAHASWVLLAHYWGKLLITTAFVLLLELKQVFSVES